MRRGKVAACVVAFAAAGVLTAVFPPTGANHATATTSYTEWHLRADDTYSLGARLRRDFTATNASFTAAGDDTRIHLQAIADQEWNGYFAAGYGDRLTAGTTYDNGNRDGLSGVGPTLDVASSPSCETRGEFTIREIDFDPVTGALQSVRLTFRQFCLGYPDLAELRGSITYHSSVAPAAVPATRDVIPGAVSALRAHGTSTGVVLTWRPPSTDYHRTEVRLAAGTSPPRTITSGTRVSGGARPAVWLSALAPGVDYAVSAFVVDIDGDVSARRSIVIRGTDLSGHPRAQVIPKGAAARIDLRLIRTNGTAIGNATLLVYERRHGAVRYSFLKRVQTDGTGRASVRATLNSTADFTVRYAGGSGVTGNSTGPITIRVAS